MFRVFGQLRSNAPANPYRTRKTRFAFSSPPTFPYMHSERDHLVRSSRIARTRRTVGREVRRRGPARGMPTKHANDEPPTLGNIQWIGCVEPSSSASSVSVTAGYRSRSSIKADFAPFVKRELVPFFDQQEILGSRTGYAPNAKHSNGTRAMQRKMK